MDNLDLDINNYSIKDIENFFKLKSKKNYSASDIELTEYQIREQLLSSGHINKNQKRDLIEFLTTAKDWLIFVKCNSKLQENQPSTISKNYKLDSSDIPNTIREPQYRENELINRPESQFVYTNNSDFFPGKLNPLNTRVITKCLNIDTRFRDNLYSTQCSDFTIQLPDKFNKVVSMQLSSIEFPVTFYGISKAYGNNFLYLNIFYFPISSTLLENTEKVFVIPDGNYNANDLIELLNNLLSPTNEDNSLKDPESIFSYIRFKLDITTSGSGSGKVTLDTFGCYKNNIQEIIMDFTKDINGNDDFININSKIGWNLGFIKSLYYGGNCYTADTIIEPATIRYIYLAIDDFNNSSNNHFVSVFKNTFISPDIIARISIKGSYFSLIMENDFNIISEPRHYFGPVDIQKLRIRLFDEHGRILSMNNSNFSFCLNLKILYDL